MQEVQLQLQDGSDSDLLGCSSSDLRSHDALVSRFGFVGAEGASAGEDNNVQAREREEGDASGGGISFLRAKSEMLANHHQVFFFSKRDDRNSFASSIPVSTLKDFPLLGEYVVGPDREREEGGRVRARDPANGHHLLPSQFLVFMMCIPISFASQPPSSSSEQRTDAV